MRFQAATKTQSILFDRSKWTATAARSWLKSHKKVIPKRADTTADYYRYRQVPPSHFVRGTFRTIALGSSTGIKAVIGIPKEKDNPSPSRRSTKPSPSRRSTKPSPSRRSTKPSPSRGTKKNPIKPPWMPSLLVDLAIPVTIDLEGGNQLKFPASGKFALASNKAGTELWIMSKVQGKRVKTSDEQAERLFEAFTGFEHDETGTLVQIRPKKFERIGRAMNIVYKSDKFSTAGKYSKYVHAFETYPIVSVDSVARPSIVALRGGRIKIRKEGITG